MTEQRPTLKEKMIKYLSDRKEHAAYELPSVSLNYTSTICNLRKDGYVIDCHTKIVRGQKQSVYRLIAYPAAEQQGLF